MAADLLTLLKELHLRTQIYYKPEKSPLPSFDKEQI